MFLFQNNTALKQIIILSFISLLACSCIRKRNEALSYYPIDSLMKAQLHQLSESHVTVTKKANIDGKEETVSFTPADTTAWAKELDVFTALQTINKPTYAGLYQVEPALKDSSSNLLIYTVTARKTELLIPPVSYFNVYYLNNRSDIRKIKALYREENSLLKTSRVLTMEFQNIHNKIVLTSYSIEGGQKILLGDTVTFSVKSTVTLP
jgi:hypothetical protein